MIQKVLENKSFKYDEAHDVLHVFLPPEVPWVGDELLPGVIVKRAEKDDRIVGAIVFDFSRRDKKILLELLPFLEEILQISTLLCSIKNR